MILFDSKLDVLLRPRPQPTRGLSILRFGWSITLIVWEPIALPERYRTAKTTKFTM